MKRTITFMLAIGFAVVFGLSANAATIKFLSANIGNADLICRSYNWKLCQESVEKRVTASIRAIDADVVFLEEAMSEERCQGKKETRPGFVCYDFANRPADQKNQARRVLGPDYTIVMAKGAYEVVAVKKGVGHISGCPDGNLCMVQGVTIPPSCDQQFSLLPVDAEIKGKQVRLIDAHPDSVSTRCRAEEVDQAFKAVIPGRTLMSGDWNLDPYHNHDASVKVWKQNIAAKGFHYLSGPSSKYAPYYTDFVPIINLPFEALDHVVSDFATGTCQVLGISPGTKRLDGGYNLDHRGILCNLDLGNP
jgi:hypothetical protein